MPGADRWVGTDRQLVLGPAGVGKSHRLRESFVEALRGGGAAETLLLVPTSSYRDHTRNLVLREGAFEASRTPRSAPFVTCWSACFQRVPGADREIRYWRGEVPANHRQS